MEGDKPTIPFKNFDPSKFKIVDRSNAPAASDTPDNDDLPDTGEGNQSGAGATGDEPDAGTNKNSTSSNTAPVAKTDEKPAGEQPAGEQPAGEQPAGEQPAGEQPAGEQPAGEQPQGEYTEQDFQADMKTHLEHVSGGKITDPQQIVSILTENETLKTQLSKKELEFPSPQAKLMYEYSIKAVGHELPALAQYVHVQGLPLATLSPREKQLEAYVLSRPDITRSKAETIFNTVYDKKYEEMEGNIILQDDHDVATREAEKKILAMQKEFSESKTVPAAQPESTNNATPEPNPELIKRMTAVLDDFGGLAMKFDDTPTGLLNLPIAPEEVSAFKDMLVNPTKLLDQLVQKCTINGKFDDNAWANMIYAVANIDRLVAEARVNGINTGKLGIVQANKNTTLPKKETGAPVPQKKSFTQVFGEAVKKSTQKV